MTKIMLLFLIFELSVASAQVEKGRLNIGKFCSDADACQELLFKGDWNFVRGQVMSPSEILKATSSASLNVPGTWHKLSLNPFHDGWSGAEGVGTYYIYLDNIPKFLNSGFAIKFMHIFTAYKVILTPVDSGKNTTLVERGWDEAQPLNSQVSLKPEIIPLSQFEPGSPYLLTIQVANSLHGKAGVRKAPILGHFEQMITEHKRKIVSGAIFAGAILIIAVYHFLIHFQRKSDKSSFWLAFQCLIVACFVSLRDGLWEEFFDPSNLLLSFRTRFEYGTHIWGCTTFYLFLSNTFPEFKNRISDQFLLGINGLGFLFICLPLSYLTRLYTNFYLISMVVIILLIVVKMAMLIKVEPMAKIVFGAMLLLACAAVNDGLLGADLIKSTSLMSYGQVLFLLAQGYVISLRFAVAHATARRLSKNLQQEVEKQTSEIKSIFKNIGQGIFTIGGSDGLEVKNRSPYLDLVLGGKSHDFDEIFEHETNLGSDELGQMKSTLGSIINEDYLNFESNAHLLPSEYVKTVNGQERLLEVSWGTIVDNGDVVQKALVTIRDVTELRMLQIENVQKQKELQLIADLLTSQEERFLAFYKKTKQYLEEIENLFFVEKKKINKEYIRVAFMNLHTIKGIARTIGLTGIANIVHHIEDQFSQQRESEDINQEHFLEEIQTLEMKLEQYQTTAEAKLGWDAKSEFIRIPKSAVINGLSGLASNRKQGRLSDLNSVSNGLLTLEERLQGYSGALLKDQIFKSSHGIGSIARSLGKQAPNISFEGDAIMLSESGIDLLQDLLAHLLRNSVDHGLEHPDIREQQGKSAQGSIHFESRVVGSDWRLTYYDDGRGLDLVRIKAKAEEAGAKVPENSSNHDIAMKIFDFGVSTAKEVTDISGRGVGMDAVRSFLQSKGGEISIELDSSPNYSGNFNFRFQIIFPRDLWWEAITEKSVRLAS